MREEQYGEQLYQVLSDIIINKKNALLIENLRGENAVLTYLARHAKSANPYSVYAGELSDHLSLVPGRMTDILKNLEKKGQITRTRDTEDKRRVIVTITEEGLKTVKEKREMVRQQYSGLYQYLGGDNTLKLIELLKKTNDFFK